MDPVTMAFLVALSTATPSVQHMPYETCLAHESDKAVCIQVEPPCGGDGELVCVDEPLAKKKPSTKRVYYRKNGRLLYRTVRR